MGQIIGAGVVALTGVAIGMIGPSVVLAYPMAALFSIVVSLPAAVSIDFDFFENNQGPDGLFSFGD